MSSRYIRCVVISKPGGIMQTVVAFISILVVAMSFTGCGGSSGAPAPTNEISVNALDGKVGIATDAAFRYTFSGTVEQSSVTISSYYIVPTPASASLSAGKAAFDPTICNVDNALEATVNPSTSTAVLTPAHNLSGGTGYTICLTSDITVGGTPIAAFMASFTTVGGGSTQNTRFRITNNCDYSIWIQQDSTSFVKPEFVQLAAGAHQDFTIPDGGQASTSFWAKKGCDTDGQNCTIGQSIAPCPAIGCAPPIDSRVEVTWGCVLADQSMCNKTPQGDLIENTIYNSDAVDGYTFPYTITIVEGTVDESCANIDCSGMMREKCPFEENLSQGQTMTHPEYAKVNLQSLIPQTSTYVGCFSPCQKLDFPGFGGVGLQDETSDEEILYCCPSPTVTAEECRAGPVPNTEYVTAIRQVCAGARLGYAYDDDVGSRSCPAATKIEMAFGPNCP